MDTGTVFSVLIFLTFVFLLAGIPVYIGLLMTGFFSLMALSLLTGTPVATLAISQSIFNGMGNLSLLAIPFFMLAGEIMNRGGITEKLVKFAMLLIGRLPGSLANSGIIASMFFGGITGSAQATSSCMGGILIPAMKKEGYSTSEACGVIAGASTCGPIIPPSIIMVVYATAVGCSVGAMFMGGIIPGILCGLTLIAVVLLRNKTCKFPRRTEKLAEGELRQTVMEAIGPLGIHLIVVGGIMSGVCTVNEAGAIAVFYSLFVSLYVTKTLKMNEMGGILLNAVNSSAPILLIIACAKVFSYGLTALQMPQLVSSLILSLTDNTYVFFLLVNILLIVMGMFMDGGAAVVILAPILAPVAVLLDISLVQFGVVMAFNLTIGNITPPLGYCLFITSKIGQIPVESVVKGTAPYLIAEIGVLLLITYIPDLITAIPLSLGYKI